ncbi:uncharacterized protein METZ01_LOCUS277971, partial [marine metagenome]
SRSAAIAHAPAFPRRVFCTRACSRAKELICAILCAPEGLTKRCAPSSRISGQVGRIVTRNGASRRASCHPVSKCLISGA